MLATRVVSGPLSSAVLKQWHGSGNLGTGTTQWQPETIPASPQHLQHLRTQRFRNITRPVFKTWRLLQEEVCLWGWAEGYFLWRNFILLPGKRK